MIADKDFAGFKAGDNILENTADQITRGEAVRSGSYSPVWIHNLYRADYGDFPVEGAFDYKYYLGTTFSIMLEMEETGLEDVYESVSFSLSMPVQVGLYLTWLNDKISDPDAPFPYRDEVLTCTFSIDRGLR